jgi:bacterioferritin-associated ferredoxin
MIVCSCNRLTCADIRGALRQDGAPPLTPAETYASLGCRPDCGCCARTIARILAEGRAACATQCAPCGHVGIECAVSITARFLPGDITGKDAIAA